MIIKNHSIRNIFFSFLSVAAPLSAVSYAQYIVPDDFKDGVYTYGGPNQGVLVNGSKIGNPSEIVFSEREISGNTVDASASLQIQGGFVSTTTGGSAVTVKNSKFLNNSVNAQALAVYDALIKAPNIVAEDSEFSGNTVTLTNTGYSSVQIYGVVTSVTNGETAEFTNVIFDSNIATSSSRVQGGVLYVFGNGSNQGRLTVTNSSFTNNSSTASGLLGVTRGGAIENYSATLNVTDTLFENNSVTSTGSATSYGGAVSSRGDNGAATTNLTDVVFTGNSSIKGYGGAVAIGDGSTVTFKATKNAVFSGNYATSSGSSVSDARGGFLYIANSSYANFDIASGVKLVIGDGTAGYDSIASTNAAVLSKNNTGLLLVNSSMNNYTGTLNVNEGEMQVLNLLGASTVNIEADASLVLLSGGYTSRGYVNLERDSSLTFILGADFDENGDSPFYLLEGTVTLFDFDEINDAVSVKYNDHSDYAGNWYVTLDSNGIAFNPISIPEPSTFTALLGAMSLAFASRRGKR